MPPTDLIAVCLRSLILETDPPTIASRVSMRGADTDIPLSDQVCGQLAIAPHHHSTQQSLTFCIPLQVTIQTFSQAIASAKEQLARSLLK